MRKIAFIFFCVWSLPLFLPTAGNAEIVDRIVAVVNDDIITLSELNEHGSPYFQAIMAQSPGNAQGEMAKMRQDILDLLIDRLLVTQAAEKYGVAIDESDIDQAVQNVLTSNNITGDQFRRELLAMGSSEERYREDMRHRMLKSRLVNIEIRSKLVITEERIKNYYDNQYRSEAGGGAEGYHIQQIGVLWDTSGSGPSRDEAIQKAIRIKTMIDNNENFQNLAKTYSELPSAEDGGDIGVFKVDEMAAHMKDALIALQPGQSTDVIETPQGFEIYKLISHTEGSITRVAPLEMVKDDIREALFRQDMEAGYGKWVAGLRDKAFIKENL